MTVETIQPLHDLKRAAQMLFGDARRVNTLRTEINNGNLNATLIAGKYFVRDQDLEDMVEKCRENQKARISTGTRRNEPTSSETVKKSSELAQAKLKTLKFGSMNTSQPNGNQTQQPTAEVHFFAKPQ